LTFFNEKFKKLTLSSDRASINSGLLANSQMTGFFETWTPVLDGVSIENHPLDGFRNGKADDKNLILGHTSSEGSVFVYSILSGL
jgi:carboxylesterase type B